LELVAARQTAASAQAFDQLANQSSQLGFDRPLGRIEVQRGLAHPDPTRGVEQP
jgi:hypothetical protein